jgi:hypothetical protein
MNMSEMLPAYWHRQRGPWFAILYSVAIINIVLAAVVEERALVWLFGVVGFLVLILATSMHHLTIADGGEFLSVQFGPLPVFRKKVHYDEIESAERGRTMFLDGWGIHYSLRGGWIWNIWGYDCIVLKLKRSTLRIGTNDVDQLLSFIHSKVKTTDSK